jgi:lipopolysaccharide/colanic/teichoic acid biosynthesis glycosyltransferase
VTSIGFSTTIARRQPARRRPHFRPASVPPGDTESGEGLRRTVNVLVALAGLVLAAPFMLMVAVAIKLTSKGPVLYTQTRVGVDRRGRADRPDITRRRSDIGGRPFRIFKFRTMAVRPMHEEGAEVWASPDDPRVTPVGRVLRKYRLDELPQLWNVLRGDMNVVGPRPEQPSIFVNLREQIDGYHQRQRVRPGITGWAQVNHSYDRCLEDVQKKVSLDLEYIARQSLAEDLKIMAMTVPVMVLRKGAW